MASAGMTDSGSNGSASTTAALASPAIDAVRYSTKTYTVYEPRVKDVIVPNLLEMVDHIKHFNTDIRVGDRVTVDAGPHRAHLSGDRILCAITLRIISGKSQPRVESVLFDSTHPTALHTVHISAIKTITGTASTADRIAITPLIKQWCDHQRQLAANATVDAYSALTDTVSLEDEVGELAPTESSRRSTRKPAHVARYNPSGSARSATKPKRKSASADASSANEYFDADMRVIPISPSSVKRLRQSQPKQSPTAAAAAAAASTGSRRRRNSAPAAAVAAAAAVAVDVHDAGSSDQSARACVPNTVASAVYGAANAPASRASSAAGACNQLHVGPQLQAQLFAALQQENEVLRRRVKEEEQRVKEEEQRNAMLKTEMDNDRLRSQFAALARTIGL
jgi:hypothetical protein